MEWPQNEEIYRSIYTHFVKVEVCFYIIDWEINFNSTEIRVSVVVIQQSEICACPTDKSCQRFTCPNYISTCPGQ